MQVAASSNRKLVLVVGFVIILQLLLDNVIGVSFLYSYKDRSSVFSYTYLSIIFLSNFIAQFLMIFSVRKIRIPDKIFKQKLLNYFNILMFISLAFLASTIFLLVTDMFSSNRYNPFILTIVSIYELALSMIMICALIMMLTFWVKRKKNLTVILYLVAFSVFLLSTVSAFFTLIQELEGRTTDVSPVPNPWDISSIRKSIFYDVYRIGSSISFGLFWLATSILLLHYSKIDKTKLGKWKFWLLASLPLIYYIFSIDHLINNLVTVIHQYPFLRNVIIYSFAGTKQVGGFFFALSFFFMSRNVENVNLKNYLTLSAVGIMMLFGSLQITVLYIIPYPPFGLITLSVMPISYYLVLFGLYYSARSLSYDKELLLKLGTHIRNQPDSFLRGIGTAEWSQNIQFAVNSVMRHNIDPNDSSVVESDLSPENIHNYVLDVIREIKESKSKN